MMMIWRNYMMMTLCLLQEAELTRKYDEDLDLPPADQQLPPTPIISHSGRILEGTPQGFII